MSRLFEGQQIARLLTANGGSFDSGTGNFMDVIFELGQMGLVPWVRVRDYNGLETARINVACIESLTIDAYPRRFPFDAAKAERVER
jgi:hypothetical protein